jgi:hypothetical protein
MLMDVAEVVLIILALFFYPKNICISCCSYISKLVFTMVPVINAYKELYPNYVITLITHEINSK